MALNGHARGATPEIGGPQRLAARVSRHQLSRRVIGGLLQGGAALLRRAAE